MYYIGYKIISLPDKKSFKVLYIYIIKLHSTAELIS